MIKAVYRERERPKMKWSVKLVRDIQLAVEWVALLFGEVRPMAHIVHSGYQPVKQSQACRLSMRSSEPCHGSESLMQIWRTDALTLYIYPQQPSTTSVNEKLNISARARNRHTTS
jgi:hypothetical protein